MINKYFKVEDIEEKTNKILYKSAKNEITSQEDIAGNFIELEGVILLGFIINEKNLFNHKRLFNHIYLISVLVIR